MRQPAGQTLLTIKDVAERTRVPVEMIRWLRQQGRFAPAVKVGRRLLWDVAVLDAWLIAWPSGGAVDLHDHGGAAGVITVVAGELTEIRATPDAAALTRRTLRPGAVYDVDAEAVHDVFNARDQQALSVHVYAPGLTSMTFYDPTDLRPVHVVHVAPAAAAWPDDDGRLEWTTAP